MEGIELEGANELLTVLQGQDVLAIKLQGQVDKENKPEETSKSFRETGADWIASVT